MLKCQEVWLGLLILIINLETKTSSVTIGLSPNPMVTTWPVKNVLIGLFAEKEWATQQWGTAELGDSRRTARAVLMGELMANQPDGSIPLQMKSWKDTKAAYLLLNNKAVTLEKLSQPHWQLTRQATTAHSVVLMVQDTTEIDFTAHPTVTGMGPIGDGRGQGFLLHSALAVEPENRQVLGVAHQQALLRQPRQNGKKHPTRTPEGLVWETAVTQIGTPPKGTKWVHVGDCGSDNFGLMLACADQDGVEFLLRLCKNRVLNWTAPTQANADEPTSPPARKLLDYARALPSQGEQFTVEVSPRPGEAKRQATLQLSWSEISLPSPLQPPDKSWLDHASIKAWVVRVSEVLPPDEVKPLEWVLLSSLPVNSWADAYRCTRWYACRWLIEEFHKCLKTGCHLEKTLLDDRQDIERLLGFLTPLSVRLLQLRQIAGQTPHLPAESVILPLAVKLLAVGLGVNAAKMTVAEFWQGLARLGGHLGRKNDGKPGWLTIWRGYHHLQLLVQGAGLALNFL